MHVMLVMLSTNAITWYVWDMISFNCYLDIRNILISVQWQLMIVNVLTLINIEYFILFMSDLLRRLHVFSTLCKPFCVNSMNKKHLMNNFSYLLTVDNSCNWKVYCTHCMYSVTSRGRNVRGWGSLYEKSTRCSRRCMLPCIYCTSLMGFFSYQNIL